MRLSQARTSPLVLLSCRGMLVSQPADFEGNRCHCLWRSWTNTSNFDSGAVVAKYLALALFLDSRTCEYDLARCSAAAGQLAPLQSFSFNALSLNVFALVVASSAARGHHLTILLNRC